MAAGYGSSPHMIFSGIDAEGNGFGVVEILMGGIPAQARRRRHGRPQLVPAAREHAVRVPGDLLPARHGGGRHRPRLGGAGFHRGGCGVRKVFRFLAPGHVSIYDDRHTSSPWGIGGVSMADARASGSTGPMGRSPICPGKIDFVEVAPGDRLVFETAGAGGWGNPLLRPVEAVRVDAERGFVSAEAAKSGYGVVLLAVDSGYHVDEDATGRLRHERARTTVPLFDLGPGPRFLHSHGGESGDSAARPRAGHRAQVDRRRAPGLSGVIDRRIALRVGLARAFG